MKLTLSGNISGEVSRTYYQNLCLIFFPGAKFPEDELEGADRAVFVIEQKGECAVCRVELTPMGAEKAYFGASEVPIADYVSRERAIKTCAGEAMLKAGQSMLGKLPPWGIMTGMRPAKLGRELRARGFEGEEFVKQLIKEFMLRPEKAKLLEEITRVEARATALAREDTCSLYISIPFCPTRCTYCSFVSYSTPRYLATLPDYLDMLICDIERTCKEIREKGKRILTVYIGGGTPTVLNEAQLNRLLTAVRKSIGDISLLEFTVEAGRPDTVTKEKFDIMLSYGVDRTSINPQILSDSVLRTIGRGHTVDDFFRAYDIAAASGISTINTDLIAGLPSADIDTFKNTVDKIAELAPNNITVHTYCVKRSAKLTENVAIYGDTLGIYSYESADTEFCVDYAQRVFQNSGYLPYYMYRQKNSKGNLENVGYAMPNKEGLYNIFIMEELHDIYAVGAGAVTKLVGSGNKKITRISEPKYTYEYLKEKTQRGGKA